jgi:hypothetical protein
MDGIKIDIMIMRWYYYEWIMFNNNIIFMAIIVINKYYSYKVNNYFIIYLTNNFFVNLSDINVIEYDVNVN